MKKSLSVFLIIAIFFCLSSCTYHPPEGWTKNHHTYDEVLEFARSIDPDATVSEEYTDTTDEYDWKYREWDAVIKGGKCHVASVSDWVWNDGLAAGEFARDYYRIDTDYDYTVMQNILAEKYSDWKCRDGIRSKYHSNTDTIYAEPVLSEFRKLSDDELEALWQTVLEINEEYKALALSRKAGFSLPSPGLYSGDIVRKDSHTYITEFTEEGKQKFLNEYHEDWALLDSGLHVDD